MGEIIAAFLSAHCLVFGTCPCGKQPLRRESLKDQRRPCAIMLVCFLHGIPILGFTKMTGNQG
ncbi:MAG TPA: hypothetical protein VGA27_01770 [Candidatus Binatia bacterium]